MGRSDSTRSIDRQEARKYLSKAQEFSGTAEAALAAGRWSAAGLNAIHAGISASDAAIVASCGVRSSSRSHSAVAELLTASVSEASASQTRQLTGLLGMKNVVEYEQRALTESEARLLVEQSGRLVRWAGKVVSARLSDPG